MKKWIISELGAYLVSTKLSLLDKAVAKCKLLKIRRYLQKLIEDNILATYGKEVYYHDFDCFLQKKKMLTRLINDLYQTNVGEFKSVGLYAKVVVEEFIERYPQYVIYKTTFQQIILMIFKFVFDSLNRCDDEIARVIINNTKQIASELSDEIKCLAEQNEELHEDHHKIYNLLMELKDNSLVATMDIEDEKVQTGLKLYKESLKTLFWNKEGYIERTLEGEKNKTVIDLLIEKGKVLLLGEPGCGKTIETLVVLEEVCKRTEFESVTPVYMSLTEYGVVYQNICEGIQRKLKMYIPNVTLELINQLLASGKLLLILDAADEISSLEKRNQFYFDVNEIIMSPKIQLLLTSRRNQYHGNAKNIEEISLANIDERMIDQKLREAGIHGKIVGEFYELLAYPLFLEIGITVLKRNEGRFYNKSQLIEEYISTLFYKREIEKGIAPTEKNNLYVTANMLSKLAFEYFAKPALSFMEFDELLLGTEFSHANVCDLFRIDVFSVNADIRFAHKQFKEYFAAQYLVRNISILKECDVYRKLMRNEEWQEVLVFACGMYDNLEEQNRFLDELMVINLKTYIRCVRLKNDLYAQIGMCSHEEYSRYYLKTLFDSYMTIINTYFPAIKQHFNPKAGKKVGMLTGKKPCIVGELSLDRKHLTYWFDWRDVAEDDVQLLEGNAPELYREMKHRAIIERRNISTYGVNLELSGYTGDTARAVALERIQSDIKGILEARLLLEDDYMLCERLSQVKRKIKFTKNSNSIDEMYSWVNDYVDNVKQEYIGRETELAGITYNNVDMLGLLSILQQLYSNHVVYEDKCLPGPDKPLKSGFWWDCYSLEQIVKLVQKFFHCVVESYQYVVEQNFPMMKDYFYMSQDFPLKYKVKVKIRHGEGFESQPGISYYYISTSSDDLEPEVVVTEDDDYYESTEDVFSEIFASYRRNGKENKGATVTSAGIGMCQNESYGKFSSCPIAAFLYKHIEQEFKNLFDYK